MDIIEKLSSAIPVPVVLRGGSGVPDEMIRKSIAAGVGKINVNTENQLAYTDATIHKMLTKVQKYTIPVNTSLLPAKP
ncbi:Fructose-bisphosphate aldolase [Paenibacillus konkukensis]|uniref:Fructose-bisphosphate aldolase n=1 Tax=Paenibacillus konkukensis TaxID=2020716 RepID=A0ABY4RRR0_9BACL|nr:Fructose-bisphosphate aldolase [Paenibacillus konkukensis]